MYLKPQMLLLIRLPCTDPDFSHSLAGSLFDPSHQLTWAEELAQPVLKGEFWVRGSTWNSI